MRRRDLGLGPEVIHHLLPHRRPFLMVDRIVAFDVEGPSILCRRLISANESVFDGHLPGLPLWPGVLTIEALAQTTHLLLLLQALSEAWPGDLLADLGAWSRAVRSGAPAPDELPGALARATGGGVHGVLANVDVKLVRPVLAGDVLELEARFDRSFQGLLRVHVEAGTEMGRVAHGTLTVAPRPGSLSRAGPR